MQKKRNDYLKKCGLQEQFSKLPEKSVTYDGFLKYSKALIDLIFANEQYLTSHELKSFKLHEYLDSKKADKLTGKFFSENIGKPNNTIICFGDCDVYQGIKGHNSRIGIGLLRILKDKKFQVYLINEAFTSQRCCFCEQPVERFMRVPVKETSLQPSLFVKSWKYLRHKDKNAECDMKVIDRDKLASLNILALSEYSLYSKERLKYLEKKN